MNTILYCYYAALVVVALVTLQVSGEENEWLTLSKNGQKSIKSAITKIKSHGASDDKVISVTDKAYDEFFIYVKNGIVPTIKKLEKISSERSTAIKMKMNGWIAELENINSVSDIYKNTPQNSFKKFEDSIAEMVRDAPEFAEKIKLAKPEYREILVEFGSFMKTVITKLVTVLNTAEGQLKNTGNNNATKKMKQ